MSVQWVQGASPYRGALHLRDCVALGEGVAVSPDALDARAPHKGTGGRSAPVHDLLASRLANRALAPEDEITQPALTNRADQIGTQRRD